MKIEIEDIFKPWFDYDLLDGSELGRLIFFRAFTLYRLVEIEATYCLYRRAGLIEPYEPGRAPKLPEPRPLIAELGILAPKQPELAFWSYCMRRQVRFLAEDLARRYDVDPVAAGLLGVELTDYRSDGIREFERALITRRRKSIDPAYDQNDIDQDRFMRAIASWQDIGRERTGRLHEYSETDLPKELPFPLQHEDERRYWTEELGPAWRKTLRIILEKFTVVGQGDQIKRTVDNFLREIQRQPGERKRIVKQHSHQIAEEPGISAVKISTDEGEGEFDFIRSEQKPMERVIDDKRAVQAAYRRAEKRAGERGVKLLDALIEGKTMTEAVAYSRIARRTAYRVLEDIRDTLK